MTAQTGTLKHVIDQARRLEPIRVAVVDAAQPVDDVQKAIRALVQKRLGGMAA